MTIDVVAGVEGTLVSSTRQVVLRFTDGDTREFQVREGQTVLAAAHDSGVALASQCKVGTCCTCAASLTSGEARMPGDLVTALTRDEVAGGQRLLCQTFAHADSEFEIGYPSGLLEANPAMAFSAKISRVSWVAESVVQLDLKVAKSLRFRFTAGQYCRVRVPGTDEWRSYSMASGEHEQGKLSFLVRVLPSGVMSDFLRHDARQGLSLELEGPLGGFALEPSERPHVLIAGGTGLAPMLSMIDKIRLVRPAPPVLLVFGCVRDADLFLLEELDARKSFTPSLRVRVAVESGSSLDGVVTGNPVSVLVPADILPGSVAYLCGPPGMIRAAEQALAGFGLEPSDIHSEQFLPS